MKHFQEIRCINFGIWFSNKPLHKSQYICLAANTFFRSEPGLSVCRIGFRLGPQALKAAAGKLSCQRESKAPIASFNKSSFQGITAINIDIMLAPGKS